MRPLKPGTPVTYRPRYTDFDVSAIVRRAHRDGTVTVEARHILDEHGAPQGGYLGYRYRTPRATVTARPEASRC